jgi:hypothetical protein
MPSSATPTAAVATAVTEGLLTAGRERGGCQTEGRKEEERPIDELDDKVSTRSEVEVADEIVLDEETQDLPHAQASFVISRDAGEQTED